MPNNDENKAVLLYIKFLLLWQSLYRLSDTGIHVLLPFFRTFLFVVAKMFRTEKMVNFASKLPRSLYKAKKRLGFQGDDFKWYCTCPKCSSIYDVHNCIQKMPNNKQASKTCGHIEYPQHPQAQFRQHSGTVLMKNVRSAAGTTYLYPRSIFCYRSLITSLQYLLDRPDFIEKCQTWKNMGDSFEEKYHDVYEGKIWKEFQTYNNTPFLSLAYNFCFILNVDWFQPYRHTQYSLGAIYLSVLNLPRSERYLQENTILIGIIPGPHEPKKHMNSFLEPLVKELKFLWNGVAMYNYKKNLYLLKEHYYVLHAIFQQLGKFQDF